MGRRRDDIISKHDGPLPRLYRLVDNSIYDERVTSYDS